MRFDLLPKFQLAYRELHSNEAALLRILSDVLKVAHQSKVTSFVMLELSAAFDRVDYEILLSGLDQKFGILEQALSWIESHVFDRTSQILYGGSLSTPEKTQCGVPQGSILGPLLFVLFLSDLEDIVTKHQLMTHFYVDDIQLYHSHHVHQAKETEEMLTNCINEAEE